MIIQSKSVFYASGLAFLVISSAILVGIRVKDNPSPELDVYEWANDTKSTVPMRFDFSLQNKDTNIGYDILPNNITSIHMYQTNYHVWGTRISNIVGFEQISNGVTSIRQEQRINYHKSNVSTLFNSLKPTITSMSNYTKKININYVLMDKADDWQTYESFMSDYRNQTERVNPLAYFEYWGNDTDHINIILYEFGVTISASTPHLDKKKTAEPYEYPSDEVYHMTNTELYENGSSGTIIRRGDVYNWYFIEQDYKEILKLDFFVNLYQFFSSI